MENRHYGEWVAYATASQILGVSLDTVRRRAEKGELQRRQAASARGAFRWEVFLEHAQASAPASPESLSNEPRHDAEELVPLLKQLSEHNEKLADQNIFLAGQVGFLQAQLEQAKAEILKLQAPPPEPVEAPSYPWWMFWKRA